MKKKVPFSKTLFRASNWFASFSISNKNSYLSATKFADLKISDYLRRSLQDQHFEHLTPIQNVALPFLLKGRNVLLKSEFGSGKTLCYAVSILNSILTQSSEKAQEMKGAVILTPTKEISLQTYSVFRKLDPDNLVNISRLGSMVHIAPVIPYLEDKSISDKFFQDISRKNMVNTVNWKDLDILITTPDILEGIAIEKDRKNPYDLNPKFLVLDEYDLLLGDESLRKSTISILRRFAGVHKSLFQEKNRQRQFIFGGGGFEKRIGGSSIDEELNNSVSQLEILQTEDFAKAPKNLKCEYFEIHRKKTREEEFQILFDLIQSSDSKAIIVFCNSNQLVQQICSYLAGKGEKAIPFSGGMSGNDRVFQFNSFLCGGSRVMVSTELGSRGLDFPDVNHVIQFEFARNACEVLARAGRTARCGKIGRFSSFVREEDCDFAKQIQEAVLKGESFDFKSMKRIMPKGRSVRELEEN